MTTDRYNPAAIEEKWYQHWLERGLFRPAMVPGREPFCIVIPPPNVTGSLHMGHAWDNALQDILIRWKRMQGYNTLWIPGTDHAGIATQWMVERELRKEGLTKEQLGRERFLERVWAFKEAAHGTIVGQLKRLGVSCDWERERFTLDEGLSRAVRRVFVRLHEEGLIYRANRMISWCVRCRTALSDLEVDHKEVEGQLWRFRYPLADGTGAITVATTRPETMLGDTAVAVHPEDERYRALVGRQVRLPLAERLIPIVADGYVDRAFGTGAVKITPGHDPNDFELGKRHDLPVLTVLNEDGTLNAAVPEPYRGLERFEARRRVVADLAARGLLAGTEAHKHALGVCDRCGTAVEPRVSTQWFVRMREMADAAIRAVRDRRIAIQPDFQEKVFFEWLNNIQDWTISRQLWWGHRIPVWYCRAHGHVIASEEDDVRACPHCGSADLEREQDVLDTWFSSGLWPFSTMGWPEQTEDLRTFYPTAVLVTGYDILFFWVARMAMLGLKFMEEVPFREVLLHGLLRDRFGEKMSKTRGNGLDPLDMIARYGADALRFTIASGTVLGRDMVLQESTIEGSRNFINKLWNATRYTLRPAEALGRPRPLAEVGLGRFDRWILGRLAATAAEVGRQLDARRFNEACRVLYAFAWHELCDWYVEITKPVLAGARGEAARAAAYATLHHVLDQVLRLLHPVMPFVTEELWQKLPAAHGSIMVAPYPGADQPGGADGHALHPQVAEAAQLIEVIQTIRTLRGENALRPQLKADVVLVAPPALQALLEAERLIVAGLAATGRIAYAESFAEREGYAHGVGNGFEVYLSLKERIDVAAERQRLGRELEKTRGRLEQLVRKLGNPAFVDRAPPAVVAKNRDELGQLRQQIARLGESLSQLAPD
ncbi:MAG: valine--tRNA ligase [Candidatus Lambdaproteobacteria bacterium]|nr:valine--tRNA ligase [Candidatus Lambdaproteobacteria bacterium]